jgi:hypothetical protein
MKKIFFLFILTLFIYISELHSQDVELFINKKGSLNDNSTHFIESCIGEKIYLKFNPKINISKFGFEYLENGIWKSTNSLSYMSPLLKQFSIQTIAANSKQSLKYRVKYTTNEVDILYSNSVEVKIKPCSLN